jgi:ribonucrease Y
MSEMEVHDWVLILVDLFDQRVAGVTYFLVNHLMMDKFRREQTNCADNVIQVATEKARGDRAGSQRSASSSCKRPKARLVAAGRRFPKKKNACKSAVLTWITAWSALNSANRPLTSARARLTAANDVEKMYSQQMEELQRIAQMTMEEARTVVLAEAEKEGRQDMARIIRQIEAEARAEGEKRARELIADAIQRVASEHVSEVTTSVVPCPTKK